MTRRCRLILVLLSLALAFPALAEPLSTPSGVLKIPSGEIYGPSDLHWTQDKTPQRASYRATRHGELRAVVVDLPRETELKDAGALELLKTELGHELGLDLTSLELRKSLLAPYPWPDSVELRLLLPPKKEKACAYLASGSGHTIMVCAIGPDADNQANVMSASFKESFDLKRNYLAQTGHSKAIAGPLVTGATFFMILSLLAPIGVTIFSNRRHSKKHKPVRSGLIGLGVGLVLALTFAYILLERFSGIQAFDFARVFASIVGRGLFLGIITAYFGKRWKTGDVPTSD